MPDLRLKVLVGPNAGAELPLEVGTYSIGTSPECDLVPRDSTVKEHHANLEVGADSIIVTPVDGEVKVNGRKIEQATRIEFFDGVMLGNSGFALGPDGEEWPDVRFTAASDPQASATAPTPPDGGASRLDDADKPGQAAAPAAKRAKPADEPAKATDGSSARVPRVGAIFVTLLLIGAALAAVLYFEHHAQNVIATSEQTQTAEPEPYVTRVRNAIDALGLSSSLQVDAAGERASDVTVEGYVTTRQERRDVVDAVRGVSTQVAINVWSNDLIETSVRETLSGIGAGLSIAEANDGRVQLRGVVPDDSAVQDIRQRIMQDVSGVQTLTFDVIVLSEAVQWLKNQLSAASIDPGELTIGTVDKGVVASGALPDTARSGWADVTRAFASKYGSDVSLQDQVSFAQPRTAEDEAISLPVRAINLGPPAYIALDNGRKYTVGSTLPGGMTLQEIESDHLLIEHNGQQQRIEFDPHTVSLGEADDGADDADTR